MRNVSGQHRSCGQYTIVNLPVGAYTVTFTLPSFTTSRREGIEMLANFTAPVNAELRVGALEETITVSGEAPVLDGQKATSQRACPIDAGSGSGAPGHRF